jgi:hypothetical protein
MTVAVNLLVAMRFWTGLTLVSAQALNHGNTVTEHTFHSKVNIFYKSIFPKIKTQ